MKKSISLFLIMSLVLTLTFSVLTFSGCNKNYITPTLDLAGSYVDLSETKAFAALGKSSVNYVNKSEAGAAEAGTAATDDSLGENEVAIETEYTACSLYTLTDGDVLEMTKFYENNSSGVYSGEKNLDGFYLLGIQIFNSFIVVSYTSNKDLTYGCFQSMTPTGEKVCDIWYSGSEYGEDVFNYAIDRENGKVYDLNDLLFNLAASDNGHKFLRLNAYQYETDYVFGSNENGVYKLYVDTDGEFKIDMFLTVDKLDEYTDYAYTDDAAGAENGKTRLEKLTNMILEYRVDRSGLLAFGTPFDNEFMFENITDAKINPQATVIKQDGTEISAENLTEVCGYYVSDAADTSDPADGVIDSGKVYSTDGTLVDKTFSQRDYFDYGYDMLAWRSSTSAARCTQFWYTNSGCGFSFAKTAYVRFQNCVYASENVKTYRDMYALGGWENNILLGRTVYNTETNTYEYGTLAEAAYSDPNSYVFTENYLYTLNRIGESNAECQIVRYDLSTGAIRTFSALGIREAELSEKKEFGNWYINVTLNKTEMKAENGKIYFKGENAQGETVTGVIENNVESVSDYYPEAEVATVENLD